MNPDDDQAGPSTWALVPASAEGPDGRGRFEIVVEPGQVYEDLLAVRNLGERELTVELHAQDAIPTSESAFEVLTPDDVASRVGSWVRLESDTVTVPPRSAVVVPFFLVIPEDAEPGDHAGAILAALAADSEDDSSASATVNVRTGTRVYVRVAGPVAPALEVDTLTGKYHGRWGPFVPGSADIAATVENTGNVRITPEATVTISSLFGWWTREVPLGEIGEILPTGAHRSMATFEEVPALGPLWVSLDFPQVLSRGQDVTDVVGITSSTVLIWAVPWTLLVALALLLVAAIVAVRNLRLRRSAASVKRE